MIFKFNSKVFVLKEEEEEHAITIYETYSIDQSSKIIQIVGQWTKENGLGWMTYCITRIRVDFCKYQIDSNLKKSLKQNMCFKDHA